MKQSTEFEDRDKEQLYAKQIERVNRIHESLNIKKDYGTGDHIYFVNKQNQHAVRFHSTVKEEITIWRCCIQKGSFALGYRYPIRGYTFSLDGMEDWCRGKDQIRDFWPHPLSPEADVKISSAAIVHDACGHFRYEPSQR